VEGLKLVIVSLSEIVNGAALAGAARSFGIDKDDLVDFAIKTAQSEGKSVEQVLQKMVESDLEMKRKELQTLGLDQYEDVLRGSEEADNNNRLTKYSLQELDEGRGEGREDKRLRVAAEGIADEARYREGDYADDEQNNYTRREYRSNAKYPNQYDPLQDDYVIKRRGKVVKFERDEENGGYRPTKKPNGITKRVMVKYRPGSTIERYDPISREVRERKIAPEPFYPDKRLTEPFDATVTGRSSWKEVYQKLSDYIDSGAITDPFELDKAMKLRTEMRANIDPAYAKALDFDRGAATVRRDRQGLTLEEIATRTESALRDLTSYGEQVRATDTGPSAAPTRSMSSTDVQKIRQEAILKTIHSPEEVEPAVGRRDARDMVSAEAALRADFGSKPNAFTQQLNENRAIARFIRNEDESARFADKMQELGNIGEVTIRARGFKNNGKPDWISEAPISFDDPNTYPQAYRLPGPLQTTQDVQAGLDSTVYFDERGGNPLAIQGLDIAPINVNSPDYSQNLNAPTPRAPIKDMEDFLIQNQFQTRQSGQYPQVDISGALSTFNSRLNKVNGIAPGLTSNAQSLADVQEYVDSVLSLGKEKGVRFNTFGSKERSSDPGIMEVLGKMRYTSTEAKQFANALLQLELGRTNGVNSVAKSNYFDGSGSYMSNYPIGVGKTGQGRSVDLTAQGPAVSLGRDRMTFGEAEQMSDYVVGDNIDTANQRVAPAFRSLTGENIEGAPAERAQILQDARMPYIGQIKGELVPIEGKKGNPNYRFNKTGEVDPIKVEKVIRDQARGRASKKNPRNLDRESQNIYNAQIVNARHYPALVQYASGDTSFRAPRQRNEDRFTSDRTSAVASMPAVGQTPTTPDPWSAPPGTGGGFTSMDYQKALPYGIDTDGPRQRPAAKGFKQRAAYASDDFKNYATNPNYSNRRRIGYAVAGGVAGIAGLDGLINGERNKREEEQYR